MTFDITAEVISNRFVSGSTWEIVLKAPEIAKSVKPGQFIMLATTLLREYDPMSRRPFAVADICGPYITVYYDVVGRGTQKLTQRKTGELLKTLGPLGNGYFPTEGVKKAVVVAGGIGASGVSLLVKRLSELKVPTIVLYGARSKKFLSMKDWYDSLKNVEVLYYTDDGSFGKKGFPVEDLVHLVDSESVIYGCGPKALLAYLKRFSERTGIKTYLSLDKRMACGWGVCLGCVVKTKRGYKRVCKEGPVFEASYLVSF